jgi:histidinol-phosphate/aromatic aminotransferase/cobyric acid decarboxylase-like protein
VATAKRRIVEKLFRLNPAKVSRLRKALHASTESEAIDRALDFVLAEHDRNALAAKAHERFVRSRITIRDVYGKLQSRSPLGTHPCAET